MLKIDDVRPAAPLTENTTRSDLLGVAVVGTGYWGPNLVRNFASVPEMEIGWLESAISRRRMESAGN